jgi:hypothetical protein
VNLHIIRCVHVGGRIYIAGARERRRGGHVLIPEKKNWVSFVVFCAGWHNFHVKKLNKFISFLHRQRRSWQPPNKTRMIGSSTVDSRLYFNTHKRAPYTLPCLVISQTLLKSIFRFFFKQSQKKKKSKRTSCFFLFYFFDYNLLKVFSPAKQSSNLTSGRRSRRRGNFLFEKKIQIDSFLIFSIDL